jgi:hypothetical protein
MAPVDIIEVNKHILSIFLQFVLLRKVLRANMINIILEFDTVARSRVLYHGNGVAPGVHSGRQIPLRGS